MVADRYHGRVRAKLVWLAGLLAVAGMAAVILPVHARVIASPVPPAVRATAVATVARPVPAPAAATVAAPGGQQRLSALTPVQEYNVSRLHAGPVRVGSVTYTDSVRFTCDSGGRGSAGDLDYHVSGYGSLSALAAIPSDNAMVGGEVMTVSFFYNGTGTQTSGPVTITPGHSRPVRIRLRGASQLEISCDAVDAATQSPRHMDLALANATLGR